MKKKIFVFMCIFAVLLCGCSNPSRDTSAEENGLSVSFEKEVNDYGFSDKIVPFSAKLSQNYVYFCIDKECDNENVECECELVKVPLISEEYSDYSVDTIASMSVIKDYSVYSDSDGKDIVTVLSINAEKLLFTIFDERGKEKDSFEIELSLFEKIPYEILSVNVDEYLLLSDSAIYIVNNKGNIKKRIDCPGEMYEGMDFISEKEVLISFSEKDKSKKIIFLNIDSYQFGKISTLPKSFSASCGYKDCILSTDGFSLYDNGLDFSHEKEIYNFAEHYVVKGMINDISYISGKIYLVFVSTEEGNVRIVALSETEREIFNNNDSLLYDEEGKRIIYVYSCNGDCEDYLFNQINCFNLLNKDYSVRALESDAPFDSVFIEKNRPDLYFEFELEKIDDFARNGYLENLYPFFEQSDKIRESDLSQLNIDMYEINGELYGTFLFWGAETILTKKTDGFQNGWTLEQFLDWLEGNETVYCTSGLNKYTVVPMCIYGTLVDYVDFEKGVAYFDLPSFAALLERLKNLKIDEVQPEYFENVADYFNRYKEVSYFCNSFFYSVEDISQCRLKMGDEPVLTGFPNMKRERCVFATPLYNLGVFANSECKEGAFEFVEYCLTNMENRFTSFGEVDKDEYPHMNLLNSIPLQKEFIEKSLGHRIVKYLDEKDKVNTFEYDVVANDKKLLEEMIANSIFLNEEWNEIYDVVLMETASYLNGEFELEHTIDVIQNRVSLILSEHR